MAISYDKSTVGTNCGDVPQGTTLEIQIILIRDKDLFCTGLPRKLAMTKGNWGQSPIFKRGQAPFSEMLDVEMRILKPG